MVRDLRVPPESQVLGYAQMPPPSAGSRPQAACLWARHGVQAFTFSTQHVTACGKPHSIRSQVPGHIFCFLHLGVVYHFFHYIDRYSYKGSRLGLLIKIFEDSLYKSISSLFLHVRLFGWSAVLATCVLLKELGLWAPDDSLCTLFLS